ncbi:C-type lectin domain family 4 member K-like [Hoplias malabaricus]|uniref:C-type lectin domain family 4 member K-like n=1 Tax=Hoplias malabaricus TaxID=27720 RepID=UPI003462C8A8
MKKSQEDIYVNGDFVKKRSNKDTVISVSKANNSGSNRYRLATVCLGLLYVLLLTAFTVLCVKFTAEIKQLQSSYKNLILERDRLLKEKEGNLSLVSETEMKINKPGWRYFNSSIFYISKEKKNWIESRKDCIEREADMVIINSLEEQDFVDMLRRGQMAWIGLTDQDTKGTWRWTDGSALITRFWKQNEPNGPDEHCAITGLESKAIWNWADYPCNNSFVWICQKRIFS